MSRPVVWAISAQADLDEILEYFESEAPEFVEPVASRIIDSAARLGEAQTGRPGRNRGYYEKSLTDIRYIIVYSLDRSDPEGPLNIVRIIHSSRNWKRGHWPT